MAELADFLGHILEEITRARVSADAEAIRTAKRYASDPDGLLRYFPVPRLRLPNIEITAPLIVSTVPEGHLEKTDPQMLSQAVAADLVRVLTQREIRISTAEIIAVIKEDPSLSNGYVSQSSADTLSVQIGNRLKLPASDEKKSGDLHAEVVSLIRKQIVLTLNGLPLSPVGIGIDARTSAVKEANRSAGQGANVLYVKMSISEEALDIEFKEPPLPVTAGQPTPPPEIKRLSPE
jgi:hypothetical protein